MVFCRLSRESRPCVAVSAGAEGEIRHSHLLQTCFSSNATQKVELDKISRRCVKAVYDVWEVTRPILCRQDLDGPEDAEDVGAEDSVVLNASWRSIKEAR